MFVITAGSVIVFISQKTASSASVKLPGAVEAETPTFSQTSPDGKDVMNLKKETKSGITTFTFTSNNISFYKSLPKDFDMSIPFNTWSPNDKYAFIKETTANETNYYVLPAQVNVTEKFKEKYPSDTLQEVTGWADNTLLIVNANDGKSDISLWFDVNSGNFTRLTNRFN